MSWPESQISITFEQIASIQWEWVKTGWVSIVNSTLIEGARNKEVPYGIWTLMNYDRTIKEQMLFIK